MELKWNLKKQTSKRTTQKRKGMRGKKEERTFKWNKEKTSRSSVDSTKLIIMLNVNGLNIPIRK